MPDRPATFVVRRSHSLHGEVTVPGAKNSVLKLMAATLLAEGEYRLSNVPDISDVSTMSELLGAIGLSVTRSGDHSLRIVNDGGVVPSAPADLVDRIRASINLLGPLLARHGRVDIAMPGGDDFGSRPIDLHVDGLRAMGATVDSDRTGVHASCGRLRGAAITLTFPSVGATENLLMAAVLAEGETVIDNAAREPEIADLCAMLQAMGAHISGVGSDCLRVEGVEPGALRAVEHRVVDDRVQAATYMAAVAVCEGDVFVRGARPEHMEMLLNRYAEMGMSITPDADGLRVAATGRLRSIDFATLPYPGIATDYKPLLVGMLSVADGTGIATENLYPGRFRYVDELLKLGADVEIDGHHAVVRGVRRLRGSHVVTPDIRAGAALVVAGLAAEGETTIAGVEHVDRGYDDLVGRLRGIGADVTRSG